MCKVYKNIRRRRRKKEMLGLEFMVVFSLCLGVERFILYRERGGNA